MPIVSRLLLRLALILLLGITCTWAQSATPQVAANGHTSMALDSLGNLYGWGDNGSGLLGRTDKAYAAQAIQAGTVFAKGFPGSRRIFLLEPDGTLWGAGYNQFGQLGDGSFFLRRTGLVRLGTGYRELAVGTLHTLAIMTDGRLRSWGANEAGQLGDGQLQQRNRPYEVTLSGVVSVAAGAAHSLAVLSDGTLWAWGRNQHGQLGDGTTTNKTQPVKVGEGFVQVAAGDDFSMARRADGTVIAWGHNSYGQLGDGGTTSRSTPGPLPGRYTYIAASTTVALGLDADGGLWRWGRWVSTVTESMPTTPQKIAQSVMAISVGEQHLLAQKTDGSLYALGSNLYGELGIDDDSTGTALTLVRVASHPNSFAAGGRQSVLIDATGHAWAWGDNSDGQLAQGLDERLSVPVVLATQVQQFALGASVAYVLREDGSLWAWGDNSDGRLGDGSRRSRANPIRIGDGFAAVSTSGTQTFGLKTDGSLWAWGNNSFGQLGLGDEVSRNRPSLVGNGFSAVSAGAEHTLALKTDGSLWAWGRNRYGQLGNGLFEAAFDVQTNAIPLRIGIGYTDILAGAHHSLALKTDGTLWSWGWNGYGQVGDGSLISRASPVLVKTGVAKLLSASISTLVLGQDGRAYAWGYNGEPRRNYNVLLAGRDQYAVTLPTVVAGNWTGASAGSSHALYLRRDGVVFSVGYQQFGQLGDGSFDDVRARATSVLGVDMDGLLDLQPQTANELQPGDAPAVYVRTRRQGELTGLSMGVQVRVPAAIRSTGPVARSSGSGGSYLMYVAASLPTGNDGVPLWFLLQPQAQYPEPTWATLSQPMAAYLQNISTADTSQLEFDVLSNLDTTTLAGATLYVGYGLSQDEMIQSQRYRVFFTVPTE